MSVVVSSRLAVEGHIEPWATARGLTFHHDPLTGDGVVFSPCGLFRLLLWRRATIGIPFLGFGMLNPSKASHLQSDPTIDRCLGRATRMRLAGPLVWNLFALRATDPADMLTAPDPIGEHNDSAIELALGLTEMTIAGWGVHGAHLTRQHHVLRRCAAAEAKLHVLRLTKHGFPGHPLYIPAAVEPQRWDYDF